MSWLDLPMCKVETALLIGASLEWAVAYCEIPNDFRDGRPRFWIHQNNPKLICKLEHNFTEHPSGYSLCAYSSDPRQADPIIRREGIIVNNHADGGWEAYKLNQGSRDFYHQQESALVAAMRCYVESKVGFFCDIPQKVWSAS